MNVRLEVGDSVEWLATIKTEPGRAIITSLPDAAELGIDPDDTYLAWFAEAAALCIAATVPNMPAVFLQTSRYWRGTVIDKVGVINGAASVLGVPMVGATIVTRRPSIYRPHYSTLAAWGKCRRMPCTIIDGTGPIAHSNGVPEVAARAAVSYAERCGATEVLDPFCGAGGFLRAAQGRSLDVYGRDIDPQWIAKATEGLT